MKVLNHPTIDTAEGLGIVVLCECQDGLGCAASWDSTLRKWVNGDGEPLPNQHTAICDICQEVVINMPTPDAVDAWAKENLK